MEISKHIGFTKADIPELLDYLKSNNIPYEEVFHCCIFDIYESNLHWPCIRELIGQKNVTCISETKFSKKELNSAQWLQVRSKWRNGYPQPESDFSYEGITYSVQKHCCECGVGLHQIDSFRIRKTPNWGRRHFMMLNWISDELFVDDSTKEVLCNAKITGVQYQNVRNAQGKEVLPNVNQLIIPTVLHEGLIANRTSIDKIFKCPYCSRLKYHPTGIGMTAFQKQIFDGAPDVVKTSEYFGWGHGASRLIIVSQRFYQVVSKNKLDRSLVFEPIELAGHGTI